MKVSDEEVGMDVCDTEPEAGREELDSHPNSDGQLDGIERIKSPPISHPSLNEEQIGTVPIASDAGDVQDQQCNSQYHPATHHAAFSLTQAGIEHLLQILGCHSPNGSNL